MGASSTATIAFGVDLGYEFRNPLNPYDSETDEYYEWANENGDFDLEEFLIKVAGVENHNPYNKVPEGIISRNSEYDKWQAENPWFKQEREAWWTLKKKLKDDCPLTTAGYGHYDGEGGVVLCLKGTKSYADYAPAPVAMIEIDQAQYDAAVKFCKDHKLADFTEAKWLLFSLYG